MALDDKQLDAAELLAAGGFTQKEIAEEVGVTARTIRNWQELDAFKAEVARLSVRTADAALLRGIKAQKPNIQALKLYYQRFGHLGDDSEQILAKVLNMSEEEKLRIEKDVLEKYGHTLPS